MSFDRLAAHYGWMESLLAGRKLQHCRTEFVNRIDSPREALLLGEGNGRFLAALLAKHPQARVTIVDASAGMLARARARLTKRGIDFSGVTFVHADILHWSAPRRRFDLIVSHFFLDCFQREQVDRIVEQVAASATSDAQWLHADFREPAAGLARKRAQWILRGMYSFFRRFTGLSGSRIIPPENFFPARGFKLKARVLSDWGLLHTDWWEREPLPAGRD